MVGAEIYLCLNVSVLLAGFLAGGVVYNGVNAAGESEDNRGP